ncbi:chemotaxis MotB protein [Salipiger pallidus]|uniref:Chemotaxis MotB protein n=1 Tax=Salipiger pallidus TaxID=1775170 RepID=A0A8J3EH91_9RHOB|nr:flagellar motor protein MotB [Salipiger pallidus]GGG78769.1 chemotaxis MotB protein [Salipiger pallidus]
MAVDSDVAPIIIKRKKVSGGDGHHGGAWKVAYADFVTAMMAFFLLMWLLNATTEKQRKGLADYFSPTVAISRVSGGGDGSLNGESMFSENTLPKMGRGATSLRPTAERAASGAMRGSEDAGAQSGNLDAQSQEGAGDQQLKEVEEILMGLGGESNVADELMRHIVTKVTDEGLVVELFATRDVPLYDEDDQPTELLRALSGVIARTSSIVTNAVAIEGHTGAYPLVLARNPSWDISSRMADGFRQMLLRDGMPDERIARVTAHADREPSVENPMDERNQRLEIVFLRDI